MKPLYEKYIEPHLNIIAYIFWGVVTTVANLVVYHLCYNIFHFEYYTSSVLAWIAAVAVAYLTNRKWVFHSEAKGTKEIAAEVLKFIASRLATLVMEIVLLFLGKEVLHLEENLTKYIATFLVVVLNYILSKFLVFTITSNHPAKLSPSLNKANYHRPKSPHPKE